MDCGTLITKIVPFSRSTIAKIGSSWKFDNETTNLFWQEFSEIAQQFFQSDNSYFPKNVSQTSEVFCSSKFIGKSSNGPHWWPHLRERTGTLDQIFPHLKVTLKLYNDNSNLFWQEFSEIAWQFFQSDNSYFPKNVSKTSEIFCSSKFVGKSSNGPHWSPHLRKRTGTLDQISQIWKLL